ncbi:MAG: hypothetical protein ACE5JS_08120 [Nitrospinota bacterium]
MFTDPWESADESGTVFRDVIFLALTGFMFVTILLLPHIHSPGERDNADVTPPGNVIIEAKWDDGLDTDVDLWVQAPGDVPVGYSNKAGRFFNLLRDDLGATGDPTEINFETAYTRGIAAGEYTVNLHLYRNPSGVLPMKVIVVARVKPTPDASSKVLVSTTVTLTRAGQEITAFRFRLTDTGGLVAGSIHSLMKPLRSVSRG